MGQHLRESQTSSGILCRVTLGEVPTTSVVAAEGFWDIFAHAVAFTSPEEGLSAKLVVRECLCKLVECSTGDLEVLCLVIALSYSECHLWRQFVLLESFCELGPDRCCHREVLILVEVFVDSYHDVGDERAVRVCGGKCDICFECFIKAIGLLIALCELVLGIRCKGVIRVIPDDVLVCLYGLIPILEFLCKLAAKVADTGGMLRAWIVLGQLAKNSQAVGQILIGVFLATEVKVTLEELEVALCNVELGLDGKVIVTEDLAEGGEEPVGANCNGRFCIKDEFFLRPGTRIGIGYGYFFAEEALDLSVCTARGCTLLGSEGEYPGEGPKFTADDDPSEI